MWPWRRPSALHTVDLRACTIGAEGTIALAAAVRANSSLTSLLLGDNDIGLRGAVAMAEAVMFAGNLTTLTIGENLLGNHHRVQQRRKAASRWRRRWRTTPR